MSAPSGWAWGIDCSFDPLTDSELGKILADGDGIGVFAQCLWTGNQQPAVAIDNLRLAQRRGLLTLGYISIAPGHPGSWHALEAFRRVMGSAPEVWKALALAPVDVELKDLTLEDVVSALEFLADKPQAIYTNYNTWVNYLGNPAWPAGVLKWDAGWDQNPFNDILEYGPGFTPDRIVGMQYTGGEWVDGQWADRDLFNLALLAPPPPRVIDGIGVHYLGDPPEKTEQIWHP